MQMFIPAAHAAVSRGQPGGPDKAAGSEGFMRLLLLNRRGRGGLGGARRAGNGVEKLSLGFVHGLHIAVIFILELPTKFALEMTSESLITAQPGDFLATRCSRCSYADSRGGGGETLLKHLFLQTCGSGCALLCQKRLVCCCFLGVFNGCLILCATSAEPPQCTGPAKPHKYSQAN